jgi:hypothetical protein
MALTSQKLYDAYVGDAWTQAITISQDGADFTDFSLDVLLFKDGNLVPSAQYPLVAGTLDSSGTSKIDAVITGSAEQTTQLGKGFYTGHLRLTVPAFGPVTIFVFTFAILP